MFLLHGLDELAGRRDFCLAKSLNFSIWDRSKSDWGAIMAIVFWGKSVNGLQPGALFSSFSRLVINFTGNRQKDVNFRVSRPLHGRNLFFADQLFVCSEIT